MVGIKFNTDGIDEFRQEAHDAEEGLVGAIGAGTQGILVQKYQTTVYNSPMGAFGYPRNQQARLSQNIGLDLEKNKSTVFSQLPEAVFVEFGTGIFATIGSRQPIRPKNKDALAFAVWKLPPNFKGIFIDRADPGNQITGRVLPPGAIGIVLAKSIRGMKPRPVWFAQDTERLIENMIEATQKAFI